MYSSLFPQVPIRRVHLFTLIQLACLVMLWVIKSFSSTSILFPLMLVVMIGIRKSLDFLFTRRELKILDDVMPEMTKRAHEDDLRQLEDGEVGFYRRFIACCVGDKLSSPPPVTTINVTKVVESKSNNSSTHLTLNNITDNHTAHNSNNCTTANHTTPSIMNTVNNVNNAQSS